jgi:hypothetical protein
MTWGEEVGISLAPSTNTKRSKKKMALEEGARKETKMMDKTMSQDHTRDAHLALLTRLENYLGKVLGPYEEFTLCGKTYYFSRGGFLFHKEPGSEEAEGYFCGYLDDEVWHCLRNRLEKDGA